MLSQQTQVDVLDLQHLPHVHLLEKEIFSLDGYAVVCFLSRNESFDTKVVSVELNDEVTVILLDFGDEPVESDLDEETEMRPVETQFSEPIHTQAEVPKTVVDELTIFQHGFKIFRGALKMLLKAALQIELQKRDPISVEEGSLALLFDLTIID